MDISNKQIETLNLVEKINNLKREKNAIILAHSYQNIEIDLVADIVGDSLYLSQQAAKTQADIIIFAGVYFMAQTAKILAPSKKVLLPRLESGCLMADMIDTKKIVEFKEQNPNIPVVCYVNSSAEVKAHCDICCTSANAVKIVQSLNVPKVLFVPDTYLGSYVASKVKSTEIVLYPGYCPTHLRIVPQDIIDMKNKYPQAQVLAHPECHQEVVKLADFVGSTTAIMNYCKTSHKKQFIIATELGVVQRLERDFKDKEFFLVSNRAVCPNMKWNQLEDILNSLQYNQYEINVSKDIMQKAIIPIKKMVQIS